MNEHVRIAEEPIPSLAEGLPRWRWTHADLDRMVEVGLLRETDRVELIDGEIVQMPSKGNRHERVRDELGDWLRFNCPYHYRYSNELGWRPRETAYNEPDLMIYDRGLRGPDVRPEQVLVLIEIAASSLGYDLGAKSRVYAGFGVREYWVIDAWSLVTHVHRQLADGRYGEIVQVPPEAELVPALASDLKLRLSELQID